MDIKEALIKIEIELSDATKKYGRFSSTHEALGVIREEYLELEKEIFKNPTQYDWEKMKHEVIQLGAMAVRFLVDFYSS